MTWTQQMERTAGLPADHPDRIRAEGARDREYGRSEALEIDFMDHWQGRKVTKSFREAMAWARLMTEALGVPELSTITNPGPWLWKANPFWQAYYTPGNAPLTGVIMVRSERVRLDTLVHEVAHHVCWYRGKWANGGHGRSFLAVEREIFAFLNRSGRKVLG